MQTNTGKQMISFMAFGKKYQTSLKFRLNLFLQMCCSLRTGSQWGRKKNSASEWESERRDSASEASGMQGSL